jgi:hypothetical protein
VLGVPRHAPRRALGSARKAAPRARALSRVVALGLTTSEEEEE